MKGGKKEVLKYADSEKRRKKKEGEKERVSLERLSWKNEFPFYREDEGRAEGVRGCVQKKKKGGENRVVGKNKKGKWMKKNQKGLGEGVGYANGGFRLYTGIRAQKKTVALPNSQRGRGHRVRMKEERYLDGNSEERDGGKWPVHDERNREEKELFLHEA